jgi:hypothetical protein
LAAELNLNARGQLPHEKRLNDIVVRAEFQANDPAGFGCPRGEENHRERGEFRMRPDLQTVGVRQHDVENNQIGPFAPIAAVKKLRRSIVIFPVLMCIEFPMLKLLTEP